MEKCLNIGLLSHYFTDNNLGCVALSICNIKLIDRAAKEMGIPIHYIIYVNEKQPHWTLDFTDTSYEYRVYSSCKQSLKHPVKLLSTKIFDGCDIAFNLCAGDGFTDIYGFGRVLSESYMTIIGHNKGCRMVLAPQTIGPFRTALSRAVAKKAMSGCECIFTRDSQSTEFCGELGYKGQLDEVIDVAFALPFNKIEQDSSSENIGLNVSGLLYNGGYDRKNYFGLSFSYKDYIEKLIETIIAANKRVHLIAHVITKDGSVEDDFEICRMLHEKYPETVLMPRRESPIEVKSYIAGMDVFIGARMHSTIGAFSAGVPVIPVAYSRKFNGLFGTLDYPYFIDAKADHTVESAVNKTVEYIGIKEKLKENIDSSKALYESRLDDYVEKIKYLLKK